MKKIEVGVYPFDEGFIPNLLHESLFGDFSFHALLDYNGEFLSGAAIKEKSDYAKECRFINWNRYSGRECALDMLLITKHIEQLDINGALLILEGYCKKGIGMLTAGLNSDIREPVRQLCDRYDVSFTTTQDWIVKEHLIDYTDLPYSFSLQKIDVPVVAVSGVSPFSQGYDIQLSLLANFRREGFRVSTVGMGAINELAGGYSLSEVLACRSLTEVHQVYFLNHFIKEIEKQERPDVILLAIDDPVIPLSKKHPFHFGLHAAEILSAVTPDVMLVTVINGEYNDSFYDEMERLYHYKYNCTADAYFVSRYVPTSTSMYRDTLAYAYAEHIWQVPGSHTVFNNADLEDGAIYEYVKKKLEQFGRCEQY